MISYFVNCKYLVRLSFLSLIYLDHVYAVGVGIHIHTGVNIWRIPFGFQLVPAGIMVIGLFTVRVDYLKIFNTVIYCSC